MGIDISLNIAHCPVCGRNLQEAACMFSGHVLMEDQEVGYGACQEHFDEATAGPDLFKRLGPTGMGYRGEWCERLGLMAVVNTWKGDYEYERTRYVVIC